MRLGLFIGINNYPGTQNDLSGCINDAKDWEALLAPSCDQIVSLLDAQATKVNIVANVREMLSRLKQDDWAYITYSGHGSWIPDEDGDEPDGRDECLVPYDFDKAMILDDELHELFMGRTPGSNLFAVADSCHSGTVSRMFNPEAPRETKLRFLSPAVFLSENQLRLAEQMSRRIRARKERIAPGLVLFSGCGDTEYSYDAVFLDSSGKKRYNGAFTRAAIDSLKGMRTSSSFKTWFGRIRNQLPSYSYPQTPVLNARVGEGTWRLPWVG